MDNCSGIHSKLYISGVANQPTPLGRCLFCELDAALLKLNEAKTSLQKLSDWNHECGKRLIAAESRLGKILEVVNAQAEDEGLWAVPIEPGTQNIVEAYLQAELRRLHAVIETIAVESPNPKSSFDTLLAEQEKHDPDL